MTVRPNKKFGFQSAAENLQRQRRPDRLRQTVPDRCSSHRKGAVANGRTHSASYHVNPSDLKRAYECDGQRDHITKKTSRNKWNRLHYKNRSAGKAKHNKISTAVV